MIIDLQEVVRYTLNEEKTYERYRVKAMKKLEQL